MRVRGLALAVVLIAAGCGSSSGSAPEVSGGRVGTLNALLHQPGPDVALVEGTSDYAPGHVRVSFLVLRKDGSPVYRPRARVWIATSLESKPFSRTIASLQRVGIPDSDEDHSLHTNHPHGDEFTNLYVAQLRIPSAGTYWIVAEPVGGSPIQGVGNVIVKKRSAAPAIGAGAIPSRTPTLASTGGDLERLTTRVPADKELLRYSIADSLAEHKPFVVAFATPRFCTSRTCGPVVDVVETVRERFAKTDIRFIHVEIYKNNNPSLGTNRWVREWRLPTEPFTFVVGRDGRIKAKFEGSVSVAELQAAVQRTLVRG